MVETARWSFDDGIAVRVREVMARPVFAPNQIPPNRRAWFMGFLQRSYAAAKKPKTRKEEGDTDRLEMWESAIKIIARDGIGIVESNVGMTRLMLDSTEAEQRRGEDVIAFYWLQMVAAADIRELLLDAILTPSSSDWTRFDKWFGGPDRQGDTRTKATMCYAKFARWDPALAPDEEEMLDALLDDPVTTVRWAAAMVLAISGSEPVKTRTVARLADAIDDRGWVWSYRDHYYHGIMGCEQAVEVVAQLGIQAYAARGAILRLIADQAATCQISGQKMRDLRDALTYLDAGRPIDRDQDQAIFRARQSHVVALPKPRPATPIHDYDPGAGIAFQGDLAIVPGPALTDLRPDEVEPRAGHLFIQSRSASGHHHFIVLSEQSGEEQVPGSKPPSARLFRLPPMPGSRGRSRGPYDFRLGALVVEHGPVVLRHATRDAIRIPVGIYYIHQRYDSADWETVNSVFL